MARQRIRHKLEQLSRTGSNPLYPGLPPSGSDPVPKNRGVLRRGDGLPRTRRRKIHQGLGLNWKDAVIFTLMLLFGGIYQVRANNPPDDQQVNFLDTISTGVLFDNPASVGETIELVSSRLSTDAVGIVASSQLTQTFTNNSEVAIKEAIYAFGLPDQAAVYRMRLRIGQRLIESEIREKEQARMIYDNARLAGKKASLLQQHRPNLFTTRISHIPPGESVQVEIFWQQPIRYDKGIFELRLPLAFKPRAGKKDSSRDMNGLAPTPQPVSDRHRRQVNVRLEAGFPLARLESLYHPIETRENKGITTIHFASASLVDNNDFVLRWQPKPGKSVQVAAFHEVYKGVDHQLLLLVPPNMPGEIKGQSVPREVIFVIDTSGSMYGTAMDQAKDALLYGLQELHANDRFNIIEFNSQASALFATSQPVNAGTASQALAFVDRLMAEGGTNMQPALQLALKPSQAPSRLKQVIFITDGAVENEAGLFRYINSRLGNARLFTIGIGGAPNSHFMRKAAEHGRGTYTYVAKLDEVDQRLSTLFDKISAPALTGLELDIPSDAIQQNPEIIPDLYLGEPVFITLRGKTLPIHLTLWGESAWPGSGTHLWQKDFHSRIHDSPGIARLWARQRLEDWQDQRELGLADAELLKDRMTQLALEYHLLSPFTSLVAVDKTPAPVPPAKTGPAGTSRAQRIRHIAASTPFPQTALGWKWQLVSGVLLLGLAAGLSRRLAK